MIARETLVRRTTAIATVAALALTMMVPSIADAAPRRLHGHGGRAAAAAFAGIVGTGLAIAASQNRAYDDEYYGGGPVYAAPGPYYYGDPSYGPGPHGYGTTVPYVNGQPLSGW